MNTERRLLLRAQSMRAAANSALLISEALRIRLENLQRSREEAAQRHRPGIPTTLDEPHRGEYEVRRMLYQDAQYCRGTTRLRQDVLQSLITTLTTHGVHDTKISAAEKVIIFLDYCAQKKSFRELRRIYQHSFKTFSRILKLVAIALSRLYDKTIEGKPDTSQIPWEVDSDRTRYFRGCVGAIDGSHIPVRASNRTDLAPWRNRKGVYSQNVLFACDFDMNIVFVQAGYEGSAHDTTVFRRAIEKGLRLPTSHYFLGDGGYSKKHRMLLVPYQRTRYHLREIADAALRPETKEELFNLRHARLRNCIERLIGILKKRWKILRDGPEQGFSFKYQALFVYALSGVHNFALQAGQTVEEDEALLGRTTNQDEAEPESTGVDGVLDNNTMVVFRDRLAQTMWDDYQSR